MTDRVARRHGFANSAEMLEWLYAELCDRHANEVVEIRRIEELIEIVLEARGDVTPDV